MKLEYNHESRSIVEALGYESAAEFNEAMKSGLERIRQHLVTGQPEALSPEEFRAVIAVLIRAAEQEAETEMPDNVLAFSAHYLSALISTALPGVDDVPDRLSKMVEVVEMMEPSNVVDIISAAMIAGGAVRDEEAA